MDGEGKILPHDCKEERADRIQFRAAIEDAVCWCQYIWGDYDANRGPLTLFSGHSKYVSLVEVQFLFIFPSASKTAMKAGLGTYTQLCRAALHCVGWLAMSEAAISVSSTGVLLGLAELCHFGLLLDFLPGPTTKIGALPLGRVGVTLSHQCRLVLLLSSNLGAAVVIVVPVVPSWPICTRPSCLPYVSLLDLLLKLRLHAGMNVSRSFMCGHLDVLWAWSRETLQELTWPMSVLDLGNVDDWSEYTPCLSEMICSSCGVSMPLLAKLTGSQRLRSTWHSWYSAHYDNTWLSISACTVLI